MADFPSDLAERISALLGRRDLTLQEQQNWAAGAADGGTGHDGYFPLSDSTGFQRMVPSPARIAALAGSGGSGAGGLGVTAEAAGFVKGAGTSNAATNRTAWLALLTGASKVIYFGEGDWDLRFLAIAALVDADLLLLGAGENSRLLVNGFSTYLDIGSANLRVEGLHFWSAAALTTGQIIGLDNMSRNTERLIVEDCWFTNVYVPIRTANAAALSSVNAYCVDEYRVNRNRAFCKQGLARVMTKRGGHIVEYDSNYVDCGAAGGGDASFGGIVHGYVANNGAVLIPDDIGARVTITNNVVRNIKPLADPGSSGRYGIQTNCANALIAANMVEKVYGFWGTAYDVALFTGDGTTKTFGGTLGQYLTPDSFRVKQGTTVVADDLDHGWVRGDTAAGEMLPARQKICAASGAEIGWIDYRSRQWQVTFPVAPASGAAYRGTYIVGTAVDNIEAIYTKAFAPQITNNVVVDCQGRQGMIACKGDGTGGFTTNARYQRGASVQYGAIVTGNVIANRSPYGIFAGSSAFWNQGDVATYAHNMIEGMANFLFVQRAAGAARQVSFDASNKIRHFFGQSLINIAAGTTDGMRLGLDIDGLWYAGSDPVWLIKARSISGGKHTNLVVERVTMSERATAGLRVIICSAETDAAGTIDAVIERVRSSLPWRAFLKLGVGTAGRLRALLYRPTNVLTASTIAGSALSADSMFERDSAAGVIADILSWSEDGVGGAGGAMYGEDLGGANTILVTVSSVMIGALTAGLVLNVKVAEANSHEVTLNLNGLGARPVIADGAALDASALQGGRVYSMIYDGTSWHVQGLPDVVASSLVANGGYRIHRDGFKECWGKVFMSAGSVADYTLPTAHSSWVRAVAAARVSSGTPATNSFILREIVLDGSTGNPIAVRLSNGNSYAVEVEVETRGH